MKAKTVKRLAILIAVLSLVGGTGFYTQQVRVKQTARAEMKKADEAWKNGDFVKAEELYRQLWVVFPDDVEIQIKHADAILAVDNSPKRVEQAIQIYQNIVKRMPGREDARRRLMQLKIDTAHFVSRGPQDEGADSDLKILVQRFPDDGKLLFLLGRCYEEGGNDKLAVEKYQEAIDHKAPQWIEAYQRCVSLLRGDRLKQPEEADRVINAADRVINAMVDADPDNYQVYLQRGRYRLSLAAKAKDPSSRQSLLSDAQSDFEEAKKRASNEPESYLELAKIAENGSRYGEAKSILEKGLKNVPTSAALYDKLAGILLRDQKVDKAIELLDDGLPKIKPATEQARLRVVFAELLARSGNTGKLRLQIEEMKKAGNAQLLIQYLTACYHMNMSEFATARQLLTLIQPMANRASNRTFKARVNLLLAQCHGHLGELKKQRDAYLRAYSAAPEDPASRQTWIAYLLDQGKTEEAINEYQAIVDRSPQVRLPLARLLIERNRQRPELERDWSEINHLIDKAAKDAPESAEPVVLRAEFLLAQGKRDVARQELETAQKLFPKNVKIWIARAKLLEFQERVDEALGLLDQAKSQLGDQVDLRLARAQFWAKKKGPEVAKALVDLAQNIEGFSKKDRHDLLNALAMQLIRRQNLEEAIRLLSQLAEQEPKNIELRVTLLDVAFQINRKEWKDEIDKNIKQIEEIEGGDGLMGRYCRALDLISRAAQRSGDSNTRKALRSTAHTLLNELVSRRPEWSHIPMALAKLEQQELDQDSLKDEEKQAKEEKLIVFYLQAIKLGHRSSDVLRRAVLLLIKNDRGNEALELLNSVPVEAQLASDLEREAEKFAIRKEDFRGAEQIARKAVEARPGVFSERIQLVWILLASRRQDDAEAELRKAVDLVKTDPDRWVNLVSILVYIKQPQKAEKAVREAEANLPPSQIPLALAQCCEIMGKASTDEAATRWYGEAKEWYKKEEDAHPDDLSIKRRLTEFFLRTKQVSDAKAQLNAIRKLGGGFKATETKAWARRTLASVLASGTDKQQLREALYCFEPNDQPAAIGQEGEAVEDPEDLRVLTRVLVAQKTVLQRKRAMEILESLVGKNLANSEDLFLLAQLCELNNDWPSARDKYRELNTRTKVRPDMETLNRRPYYLDRFADGLLRHHQSGDEQNLAEVQKLVDEIKQLQPNALGTVLIQLKLDQTRNQLDEATKRIRAFVDRPNPTSQVLETLANEAEKLGQFDLAEQLYDRRAAMPDALRGKVLLAAFRGRRGHAKDALDICEPLWANTRDIKAVAAVCIDVLFGANSTRTPDPAQLNRVGGWLERARVQAQNEPSTNSLLLVGLGNIREQQGRYQDAEVLYRHAIEQNDHDGVSCNNLAWLMALKDNNSIVALEYINRAIALEPGQPDFLDTRGIVHLTAGDIPSALNDLTEAVAIDPAPAKLFHLAQAHLAAKDKEKAKHYLDTARTKKGLTPNSLHALERPAYEKMLNELGTP